MFRDRRDFLLSIGCRSFATVVLWLAGATALAAEAPHEEELWYRVEVAGQPAGFMVERRIDDGEGLISESDLRLTFRRGGSSQKLAISSRFVETRDHRPRLLWSRQELGSQPVETTYRFEPEGILVSGAAGESRRPWPEQSFLTPYSAQARLERETRRLLAEGGSEGGVGSFETVTLDAALGIQPVTVRWVLEQKQTQVTVDGESRPASRWRQSQSYAPQVTSDVYLSPEGEVLKSVTRILGLEMAVVRARQEEVTEAQEGPELLVQSFIFPDRRLPNPRALRRAAYRFTVNGAVPALPSLGAQRHREDGVVVVDLDQPVTPAQPVDGEKYLVSSTFIQHRDPSLRGLHRKASATWSAGAGPARRAEALRRFVARHLAAKNLDSVLATAVEAAASRSGDCTEHAVLLAALLRADGIPARVATGVIYVESFAGKRHLFAYHMWTQALLDGQWRDLDATLEDTAAFDAAHITLDTPDLDDEGAALMHMAGVAPLIGRASVEVLDLPALSKEKP